MIIAVAGVGFFIWAAWEQSSLEVKQCQTDSLITVAARPTEFSNRLATDATALPALTRVPVLISDVKTNPYERSRHRLLQNLDFTPNPLPLNFSGLKDMQSSSTEIALVLRRLAQMLETGGSASVRLANENIRIPSQANISCKYEHGAESNELSVRVTWGLLSSTAQLILQHSERVLDTLGNAYDVFIYGEPRLDGTWEGWLEFVPVDPALSSRRTERETTQPDLAALEYWATGLEPLYLSGAFGRAT